MHGATLKEKPYYRCNSQRPDYAEEIAVSDTATIARQTGCETSVVHLSSARGLEAARRGRREGARYRVETCPQYLLLPQDRLLQPDAGLYTFTHLAHHRGQLTVYLRLNGARVPSLYGPSADEASFG